MDLNFGYVANDGALEFGYTGAFTGGTAYPYQLTSHGAADPNSIMADANFASTDPVDLRIISDFDPAKVTFDWQAFSDQQLWRDDVNTLAAVTVNATADTTDTATIGWRTSDGKEGQFTATVTIVTVIGTASHQAQRATHKASSRRVLIRPIKNTSVVDISPTYTIAVQ